MKNSLELKLSNQLTMTPQLQQAIRLLQLSALDLQQEIQTAIESNPLLEIDEEKTKQEDSVIIEDYKDVWSKVSLPKGEWSRDDEGNAFDNRGIQEESLQDHLFWQLHLSCFTDSDFTLAERIIESINEEGYLTTSLEEITENLFAELNCTIDESQAVLHRIQHFDPIGVGARNLSECLGIQAKQFFSDHPLFTVLMSTLKHYLNDVAKKDKTSLMKKLHINATQTEELLTLIQGLNPKPGLGIGHQDTQYIVPDAFVTKVNDRWVVQLNFDTIPHVKINQNYASLIRKSDSSRDNQFLKNQLQEAKWFLKSLENRQETLKNVIVCIVEKQKGFLEYGEEAMRPLILSEVAEILDMHESTISRVTTQKYIHTPRGIFELKYFFSSQLSTTEGGTCSATAIRAVIKKLIAAENPRHPLSDNQLSTALSDQGIKVARRTIAKYREALNIPPSHERKQFT
jgi:RNA polymerase sigma-54 factor